jgi:hypothetical protein
VFDDVAQDGFRGAERRPDRRLGNVTDQPNEQILEDLELEEDGIIGPQAVH